jgi:D-alanyl-lipoteichoic acid acyltransferase DltB (MBOAT superfamily)
MRTEIYREASFIIVVGIGVDLAVLAYFKYAHFFLVSANQVLDTHLPLTHVVLPLGI